MIIKLTASTYSLSDSSNVNVETGGIWKGDWFISNQLNSREDEREES